MNSYSNKKRSAVNWPVTGLLIFLAISVMASAAFIYYNTVKSKRMQQVLKADLEKEIQLITEKESQLIAESDGSEDALAQIKKNSAEKIKILKLKNNRIKKAYNKKTDTLIISMIMTIVVSIIIVSIVILVFKGFKGDWQFDYSGHAFKIHSSLNETTLEIDGELQDMIFEAGHAGTKRLYGKIDLDPDNSDVESNGPDQSGNVKVSIGAGTKSRCAVFVDNRLVFPRE